MDEREHDNPDARMERKRIQSMTPSLVQGCGPVESVDQFDIFTSETKLQLLSACPFSDPKDFSGLLAVWWSEKTYWVDY